MNILLANDDGIFAQGIKELAEALSGTARVFVCAPDSQRSASGHGITVSGPIAVEEVNFPTAERAFSFSGTPADCVKLGMRILYREGIKVDMVFAGINHGANLGTDVLYSGTVSAAIEGVINGVPAVAVSVNNHEPRHFTAAKKIAAKVLQAAWGKIDCKTVLNVNIPDLAEKEIRGVRVTTLGAREYDETFKQQGESEGKALYRYAGIPVTYENLPDHLDTVADEQGFISITPLHYDLTNYQLVEELSLWDLSI